MTDWSGDEDRWSHWMVQAQAGDESAYVQLLSELAAAIKGYLLARFGVHGIVDDCVQECLIAIHHARHTYDHQRSFRPWLFAIVRHKAIDMLRKNASQRRLENAGLASETEPRTFDDATLNATTSAAEASRLLGALSTDHREAVLLTKFWGFSVSESAARLGVSESVVKVRVHRAINKMRQLLEAEAL